MARVAQGDVPGGLQAAHLDVAFGGRAEMGRCACFGLHQATVHTFEQIWSRIVDFGAALAALKAGRRITREGWNGKGMFVAYQAGYPDGIAINANTAEATGIPQGTVCSFRPYLMMKAADDTFVPWVASQTDLLAEDWATV